MGSDQLASFVFDVSTRVVGRVTLKQPFHRSSVDLVWGINKGGVRLGEAKAGAVPRKSGGKT